ncbi:MAG: hypothetical protein V4606_02285 [Patescibacteria group bacterium]
MQQPSILIIQFRLRDKTRTLEQQSIQREIGPAVKLEFISALDTTCLWDNPALLLENYAGVMFGGSGDFDFDGGRPEDDQAKSTSYVLLERLRPLLDYIFEHDIPTLGICYGHQIIGAYAGANVVHDETQKKNRSHEVSVVVDKATYCICDNIPNTFFAHYGHKDSLDRVPDGAVLLMNGGSACQVSALNYKQNIFTTQFHPELSFEDLYLRIEATPGYLPEGVAVDEAFTKNTEANTILYNFGALVHKRWTESHPQ